MSSVGWIVVLMVAAILLPSLLLVGVRVAIRFSEHPTVVAFHRAVNSFAGRHQRAWAIGNGVAWCSLGMVQWWSGQTPTFLFLGLVHGWLTWLFLREGQQDWLLGPLADDFADAPEPVTPESAPAPPPLPTGSVWGRADRPPSAAELRRRARGQRIEPVDP